MFHCHCLIVMFLSVLALGASVWRILL